MQSRSCRGSVTIRSVLTPLAQLAGRHDVAVICIRHLTKSARCQAMYRGQGSIGYTAAARAVHQVGVNPHNSKERVMACVKNNLALFPPALAFAIDEDGTFQWKGERKDVTPESMLESVSQGRGQPAQDEAEDFLLETLSGGPRPAKDVKQVAEDAGISERTLERAKAAIGVTARRDGFGEEGKWVWELPEIPKTAKSAVYKTMAAFGGTDTSSRKP